MALGRTLTTLVSKNTSRLSSLMRLHTRKSEGLNTLRQYQLFVLLHGTGTPRTFCPCFQTTIRFLARDVVHKRKSLCEAQVAEFR